MVEQAAGTRTRTPEDDRRLENYERRMAMPIFLSAVLPIVFSLAGAESIVSNTILIVAWFVFIADLVIHVRLVPRFLRSGQGIFDLIVVILTAPWFLIPGLGDARFLVLARLARLVRIVRAGGGSYRRLAAQLGRVGLVTLALTVTCAYVAYSAERSVNPEFGSFGDSVWWATVTVTTVGYGDITPITTTGRITATVLMFAGLGLLGILAGALASFFGFDDEKSPAEVTPAEKPAAPDGGDESIVELRARLAGLRTRVAELDSALAEIEDLKI